VPSFAGLFDNGPPHGRHSGSGLTDDQAARRQPAQPKDMCPDPLEFIVAPDDFHARTLPDAGTGGYQRRGAASVGNQ
jgi:hypothetical protein